MTREMQDELAAATSFHSSPNRGASVPQLSAIPEQRMSISEWRAKMGIDPANQIKLVKLSHMRYQHPDLAKITTFLRHFGMSVAAKTETKLWYKGYGTDQYVYYAQYGEKKFLGGCFEVESFADLEKAATLPNATEIQKIDDAPGGGYMRSFTDPEGFQVNLIYGQTPKEAGQQPEVLVTNYEQDKPRKARFQRFTLGPAEVHKLGHFGLCVTDFAAQADFYLRTFNLVPTDFLYADLRALEDREDVALPKPEDRKDVALFAHIDRGSTYVDHHTFFMTDSATSHVHHCSFEVHDFDSQNLGHEWLAQEGYESVWGVGRHVLGSQIFDYWWDTTGNMIEHYTDGDLVNEDTPIGWALARGDTDLAVWGPDPPKWFLA
ncbi:hypothetical protein EJ05DRAFT_500117 [Pseudovirgaria hyperparasitica]|uniref:VOC domain-containing protein n=1 Tax=Pseudovirgaria hyperparasitica TaxID=470096 RepID=A0A6A6W9P3_9PEZI|nr:uncharacterized protein EJ05DRAFT_500117 [Pseudovirgaria hyperparasitica]KAF2758596.1 hypothetical protein EJ05DRAFT_500117 [Pseudovirgaria hyperparasitica]